MQSSPDWVVSEADTKGSQHVVSSFTFHVDVVERLDKSLNGISTMPLLPTHHMQLTNGNKLDLLPNYTTSGSQYTILRKTQSLAVTFISFAISSPFIKTGCIFLFNQITINYDDNRMMSFYHLGHLR